MSLSSFPLYKVNLTLSLLLVLLGLWSYESSGRDFHTLSIPVMGIILSMFHRPLKTQPFKWLPWVTALTGLYAFILLMPLQNSYSAGNQQALFRVLLMLLACLSAFCIYLYRLRVLRKPL
ncbi:MAG: hypothetical protein IPM48_09755 [Saprospiraceae bacterium]|nr:hypothetical protein [Saprospiraceae bacterium]